MAYYRKKPVVVEARQLGPHGMSIQTHEVVAWVNSNGGTAIMSGIDERNPRVFIMTLEGPMRAKHSDYIIKGVNGEFYPCDPDVFAKTYEEVLAPEMAHG